MAQLVEALRYKPEGRGFDSRLTKGNIMDTSAYGVVQNARVSSPVSAGIQWLPAKGKVESVPVDRTPTSSRKVFRGRLCREEQSPEDKTAQCPKIRAMRLPVQNYRCNYRKDSFKNMYYKLSLSHSIQAAHQDNKNYVFWRKSTYLICSHLRSKCSKMYI